MSFLGSSGVLAKVISVAFAVLVALTPMIWWSFLALTDGLTANPAQFLILSSGEWALVGLCLVLSSGPFKRWLGVSWLVSHRRMLGLFAFFYACLHVLGWAFWEQGMVWSGMWSDVLGRRFVTIGTLAFLLMIPLALTSTRGWVRRLGQYWKQLHLLVYPALGLSIWHFWMVRAGKNDFADVFVYIAVAAVLLVLRLSVHARNRKRVG